MSSQANIINKVLFISDLHLEEEHPEIANLFLNFLADCINDTQALYILGDFFEVWIGDDNLTLFNQKIIAALKHATQQGLPIYFMRGNRDFLIGKKFLRLTGCQLLPDEFVLNLFGVPTLLMHGDTLCTEDYAYLKFRKKTRCWLLQKIFLLKSLATRQAIAARYRMASKAHTSTVAQNIMDVTQAEVERCMQKHQVRRLIHGHTHRPAVHQFQLGNALATRTVLGPWHTEGNVLVCKSDGSQDLLDLSLK